MQIKLTSVFVNDQEQALIFYTEVLGFVKKTDLPLGAARWLTVVSPEQPDGPELVLEPSDNPATQTFKQAIFAQGIPFAAFLVEDVQQEFHRLKELGVKFVMEPTEVGAVRIAILDDTCGNLIQLYQV